MNLLFILLAVWCGPILLMLAAIMGAVFLRWLWELVLLRRRTLASRAARQRELAASVALGEFDDLIDLDAVRAARRGRRVA